MKRCTHCHQPKPSSAFSRNARAHDGLQSWCKACVSDYHRSHPRKKQAYRPEAHRAYYQRNRERVRWQNTLKKYGVTAAEYDVLFAFQHGACAICFHQPPAGKKPLGVDHDHGTGKVRGLLCGPCNSAIGLLGDDVGRILMAAAYVQHHGATADRVEMAAWVTSDRPDVGRHAAQSAMPTLFDGEDRSP